MDGLRHAWAVLPTVIVKDQDATRYQPWPEPRDRGLGRFVQIRVNVDKTKAILRQLRSRFRENTPMINNLPTSKPFAHLLHPRCDLPLSVTSAADWGR